MCVTVSRVYDVLPAWQMANRCVFKSNSNSRYWYAIPKLSVVYIEEINSLDVVYVDEHDQIVDRLSSRFRCRPSWLIFLVAGFSSFFLCGATPKAQPSLLSLIFGSLKKPQISELLSR